MPLIDLPADGEMAWSGPLRDAINTVNDAADEALQKIEDHVESDAPHPEYDDLPSLTLLLENGLV